MRELIVRYAGECRKCGAAIAVGAKAIHERRVGIFCPTCAPADPEAIRTYRQEAADHRADRYDDWAGKREVKAEAVLNSHKDIRSDIAFNTQPGHIPFRARLIAADDRAYGSLNTARDFRAKADRLRNGVRVAGDAAREHAAMDEAVRQRIQPGSLVDSVYGVRKVLKVNCKTALLEAYGQPLRVELHLLSPLSTTPKTKEEDSA